MTQNDIIDTVIRSRGIDKAKFGAIMGFRTRQQLLDKMDRGSIKVNELIEVLSALDFTLVLEDLKSGQYIQVLEEADRPTIRKAVCGVNRNTRKCLPICRQETDEGIRELFLDPKDNAYLMATYKKDGENRLKKVRPEVADDFIAECKGGL